MKPRSPVRLILRLRKPSADRSHSTVIPQSPDGLACALCEDDSADRKEIMTGQAAETVRNHAAFIWSVADLLRGDYKQSEYGRVILPLVVLRRLDCVLEITKDKVLARCAQLTGRVANVEPLFRKAAGQQFHNISPLQSSPKIWARPAVRRFSSLVPTPRSSVVSILAAIYSRPLAGSSYYGLPPEHFIRTSNSE